MNSTSLKLGLQSSLTRIPASWALSLTIGPLWSPVFPLFMLGILSLISLVLRLPDTE